MCCTTYLVWVWYWTW